jgi:hypothetical protein
MTENNTSPSGGSKRGLIIGGSVIVALVVVYFAFFYPPSSVRDTEGTIGAVKKYRSEQITEKDVVLEGMTSMNIEAVNKAVEQTGVKLAESAREAAKTAEGLLASSKTPEAKTWSEGLTALASKVEALKAGGEGSRPMYAQAAAIADAARENALKFEGLTAEARTPEALKALDGVKAMERLASGMRDLGVRAEYLKLVDAARELSLKADGLRPDARAEWGKLAEEAQVLANKADGLRTFARQDEARQFTAKAADFARYAADAARANAAGKQAEAAREAMEAARAMNSRAADLARPAEAKTARSE